MSTPGLDTPYFLLPVLITPFITSNNFYCNVHPLTWPQLNHSENPLSLKEIEMKKIWKRIFWSVMVSKDANCKSSLAMTPASVLRVDYDGLCLVNSASHSKTILFLVRFYVSLKWLCRFQIKNSVYKIISLFQLSNEVLTSNIQCKMINDKLALQSPRLVTTIDQ